ADLSDDGRDDVPDPHPGMDHGHESPRSSAEGRHLAPSASPRGAWLGGLHDRLPLFVHARLGGAGLTAHHVVVVVAVVVGFVALATWWLVSSRPSAVEPVGTVETHASAAPSVSPSTDAPESVGTVGEAAADPGARVIVDVTGKVRDPGIVSLRGGSRVVDAIEAAGGTLHRGVDLSSVNLARVLVDGEQIIVGMPAVAPTDPGAVPPTTAPGTTPVATVNLNTATLEQLDTLPGVGPVTGQAILDWRTENGQFTSVDELLEVDGIGEVTLADLRDLVTV
ncbi:MAG: helix-hairpin-helix domain-containing protein, partial [Nocardioidaceae bacterium]